MIPGNFDWFLHSMLFHHTKHVLKRQGGEDSSDEDSDGDGEDSGNEDSDSDGECQGTPVRGCSL